MRNPKEPLLGKSIDHAPKGKLDKAPTVQYVTADGTQVVDKWYFCNSAADAVRGSYLKRVVADGGAVWYKVS